MDFNNKVPVWADGTEPSTELSTKGFQAGYKPPAGVFNWFFNKVFNAVKELQEVLVETDANKSNKSAIVQSVLYASGWNNRGYIWSNANIVSSKQIIELIPAENIALEQLEALQYANIVGTAQAAGKITLTAFGEIPTMDIPVVFVIRGDV